MTLTHDHQHPTRVPRTSITSFFQVECQLSLETSLSSSEPKDWRKGKLELKNNRFLSMIPSLPPLIGHCVDTFTSKIMPRVQSTVNERWFKVSVRAGRRTRRGKWREWNDRDRRRRTKREFGGWTQQQTLTDDLVAWREQPSEQEEKLLLKV